MFFHCRSPKYSVSGTVRAKESLNSCFVQVLSAFGIFDVSDEFGPVQQSRLHNFNHHKCLSSSFLLLFNAYSALAFKAEGIAKCWGNRLNGYQMKDVRE